MKFPKIKLPRIRRTFEQNTRLITLMLAVISLNPHAWGEEIRTGGDALCDMGRAMQWCDEAMICGPEGIWEFPSDMTRVLIKRNAHNAHKFDVVTVDSPDTRLTPGKPIGWLMETPDPAKFEISLYRSTHKGILGQLTRCTATLNATSSAITISAPKLKLSFSPRWILPSFWRSIRIKSTDPADKLPEGIIRVYPPSASRYPDYL